MTDPTMRITRTPWPIKPQHAQGVWFRIMAHDGYHIGSCRGAGNAHLMQNADKLLAAAVSARAVINDAIELADKDDPMTDALLVIEQLDQAIALAKGQA